MGKSKSVSASVDPTSLPFGWIRCVIGDIVSGIQGGVSTKKEDYVADGVLVLNKGNIKPNGLILFDRKSKYVSTTYFEENNSRRLDKGDVVVTLRDLSVKADFLGLISTYEESVPALLTQGAYRVDFYPEIESRFVILYSNSIDYRVWVKSHKNGSTQVHLRNGQFLEIPCALPPKNEQTRIVTAIESLQQRSARARALLTEVEPLIKNLRQSILQSAFSGRLTADWRAKNPDVEPADRLLERIRNERRQRWEMDQLASFEAKGKEPPKNWKDKYKEPEPVDDSELPELPEGWCWTELESICTDIGDVNHRMPKAVPTGIPYIATEDFLPDGEINFSNAKKISEKDYEELCVKIKPEMGDVIFSRYGTIGEVRLVKTSRKFQASYATAIIKPVDRSLSRYVACALGSYQIKAEIDRHVRKTAQPNLGLTHIRRFSIPVPPAEEQAILMSIIGEVTSKTNELLEVLNISKRALDELDQSTLSKAFRGELVAQDPNDEPASEFLTRIRSTRNAESLQKKKGGSKKKANKKIGRKPK